MKIYERPEMNIIITSAEEIMVGILTTSKYADMSASWDPSAEIEE